MSKSERKDIPSELRAKSGQRSADAIESIRAKIVELEREKEAGFKGRQEPLDLRSFQISAGVNPRFLYGTKHKSTLLVTVNEFIARFNKSWFESQKPDLTREQKLENDVAYWRERYLKLARHANAWFHERREMGREVRDLRIATGKVVPIT
jgi:hypothetical protein